MRFDVITLFPEMIRALAGHGIQGRAIDRGLVEIGTWNPRDYTRNRYGSVDDRPYGGGPGMVMQVQPLRDTLRAAREAAPEAPVIYLSPQGRQLTQTRLREMAGMAGIILLAGRYEGIDERVIDTQVDEELSLGSYPGRWAMQTRRRKTPSWTVCWIIRTTRGRRRSTECGCRNRCLAATTPRYGAGA